MAREGHSKRGVGFRREHDRSIHAWSRAPEQVREAPPPRRMVAERAQMVAPRVESRPGVTPSGHSRRRVGLGESSPSGPQVRSDMRPPSSAPIQATFDFCPTSWAADKRRHTAGSSMSGGSGHGHLVRWASGWQWSRSLAAASKSVPCMKLRSSSLRRRFGNWNGPVSEVQASSERAKRCGTWQSVGGPTQRPTARRKHRSSRACPRGRRGRTYAAPPGRILDVRFAAGTNRSPPGRFGGTSAPSDRPFTPRRPRTALLRNTSRRRFWPPLPS